MSEPARDARPIPRGSKACRRLFGPVDGEQLRRDCDALMASCAQEARERWNFDFVTETPLEGDFAWERVRGLGLPKLYLSPGPRGGRDDLRGGKRPSTSPALLQGTAEEDHVDLSLSCTLLPHPPERPEGSPGEPGTSQGRKRRQTIMTGEDRCREGHCKGPRLSEFMVQGLTSLVQLAHQAEGETGPERGSDLHGVTQQACSQDQLASIYWEHSLYARPFAKFLSGFCLVLIAILYQRTFLPPFYRQGNKAQRAGVICLRSHSEFAVERKRITVIS
uniref:Cyclin-dependent kinase inhibitor 1 n=2 Tax=Equus caballus TaxID=9796 RepID=F6PZX1_HORSE